MSTPLFILIISTIFMVTLLRGFFKLMNYTFKNDASDSKQIMKFFLPALISVLVVLVYFIFILPNQS